MRDKGGKEVLRMVFRFRVCSVDVDYVFIYRDGGSRVVGIIVWIVYVCFFLRVFLNFDDVFCVFFFLEG